MGQNGAHSRKEFLRCLVSRDYRIVSDPGSLTVVAESPKGVISNSDGRSIVDDGFTFEVW